MARDRQGLCVKLQHLDTGRPDYELYVMPCATPKQLVDRLVGIIGANLEKLRATLGAHQVHVSKKDPSSLRLFAPTVLSNGDHELSMDVQLHNQRVRSIKVSFYSGLSSVVAEEGTLLPIGEAIGRLRSHYPGASQRDDGSWTLSTAPRITLGANNTSLEVGTPAARLSRATNHQLDLDQAIADRAAPCARA